MERKLIIFDFDGTLADTLPWFLNAIDQAAEKYRFKRLDRHNLPALRGLDARQMMALHQIPFWKLPAIARYMRGLMAQDIAGIALFGGVAGVLQALHARGAVLAIVSSNSRQNIEAVLGPQLAALFSHYQCGAALFGKLSKVRKVLAESGIARAQAIMVGDELRDAQVAREGGIAFGAVAWGYNHIDTMRAHGVEEVFLDVAAMGRALAV